MKKWLMTIVGVTALALMACGGEESASTNEVNETEVSEEVEESTTDVVDVGEIVKENCASCHSGDFALEPGSYDISVEEMEDIIINGIGSMPAIEVTEDEATLMAEYLID